jgi:hypothetical protein|tara:strand:+ start:8354 stop:8551 length:198 start_codon:yes stop_codon:yes gene_type:complete
MEELDIVQFVQRSIKERRTLVLDTIENNGIRTMEQYQLCMGELNALNFVAQELSGLLDKQEHRND